MCERRSPRRILAVSGCAQAVSGTPGNDQSLIAEITDAWRAYPAGAGRSIQTDPGMPASLRYEPGLILVNGDYVIVHGRFSNIGLPKNWIAADIVRIAGGVLVEHWDVLQDEATRAESQSGLPMFGEKFPE